MKEFDFLMRCLPQPPQFRFDWDGLRQTALGPMLEDMRRTEQQPEWHGEGDVWIHTRMVCEALAGMADFRALPEGTRRAVALAALLHDAGKIRTTRVEDGKIVSPGHGATGARMARELLWKEFGMSGDGEASRLREAACLLIRYHTLPLHLLEGDAGRRARRVAANGELVRDFSLRLLCMLAEADVRGRVCGDQDRLLEEIELSRALAEEAGCLDGPYAFPSECTRRAYLAGRDVWPGQALYDESWGEVILMCGLPGTGKDTWIARSCPGLPVVSLDELRRQMGVKPTDEQGPVAQAARELARTYLRKRQPFVWNATSLTPSLRAKQIRLFEEYGASVRIVWLETAWEENLRRNRARRHAVPEGVIERMLGGFQLPEVFEARRVEWQMV